MSNSDNPVAPRNFARYRTRAAVLVRSPEEIKTLAVRAARKAASSSSLKLETVRAELSSLIALLKAYANGSYREISSRTLIAVAAAVLYFVVPLDLVPDFILGFGLIDDAAVIGYVFNMVRKEVEQFLEWQRNQAEEAG